MDTIDRRTFLATLTGSLVSASALPLEKLLARGRATPLAEPCWLDVAVPFVVEDPGSGLHTEIILTAACFKGVKGYTEKEYATEYEILLYDHTGQAQSLDGSKPVRRLSVPAMHTTVLRCRELLGKDRPFWGGMRIRILPRGGGLKHIGDLFSAAFVRWSTDDRFDNVHANPDPPQLVSGKFHYSMPIPNLQDYACTLALFNPYPSASVGKLVLLDRRGAPKAEKDYKLESHASALFDVSTATFSYEPKGLFTPSSGASQKLQDAGNMVIENEASAAKSFAYLLIKGRNRNAFSVEHPLYQGDYPIKPTVAAPFTEQGSLRVKSLLYSPLLFKEKRVRDVNLSTRVYLSIGRALEDTLWIMPFVTYPDGSIAWVSTKDDKFRQFLPEGFYDQGMIKLKTFQSYVLDADRLPLANNTSAGIALAAAPETSHTLMKVEVRATNWGASAFTHFRPGGPTAWQYRQAEGRGDVVTDYLVSGARVTRSGQDIERDCLLAIMNIDFQQEKEGDPILEVFGSSGFITSVSLGKIPALGCRHVLLSDLIKDLNVTGDGYLTLRLVDRATILIMSAVHLDFKRKDLALDHGSDRHATYVDYHC